MITSAVADKTGNQSEQERRSAGIVLDLPGLVERLLTAWPLCPSDPKAVLCCSNAWACFATPSGSMGGFDERWNQFLRAMQTAKTEQFASLCWPKVAVLWDRLRNPSQNWPDSKFGS